MDRCVGTYVVKVISQSNGDKGSAPPAAGFRCARARETFINVRRAERRGPSSVQLAT